jgi:hypothetical protein
MKVIHFDRPIEYSWGDETITAQTGDEGPPFAWSMRDFRDQSLTPRAAAVQLGHVRLRPGLIDEDQSCG